MKELVLVIFVLGYSLKSFSQQAGSLTEVIFGHRHLLLVRYFAYWLMVGTKKHILSARQDIMVIVFAA